jgi:CO dehydrogenase nickel-insertion accessory protein CooC1
MARIRVEPSVCFGSSQRSWVTSLINYVSDHGGMRVVGTVLTQDDAVALDFDVLVIDDVSSVLSPRLVDRLQARGRIVVGIFDAERGATAKDRLLTAGVDAAVASDASAAEIVRAVVDAVRQSSTDQEFADIVDSLAPVDESALQPPATAALSTPTGRGNIIMVTGADGVTEVAVALAQILVGRGGPTVLVDMDTLEPSIAQRLGVPLTPNIFTATEHLRLRSSLDDAFLRHAEGFAVIAGIPNPREWENLSETEAADLIGELTTGFDQVVVKINRHLEDLSSFGGTAGRFDIGRRLMAMADAVVAVSSPSPLGSARLLALASDARRLTSAPLYVVVNQAPSSQFVQGEISDELSRSASPADLVFLPTDARVRKASWQGELVRGGPFMRKLSGIADVFAQPVSRGWRRSSRSSETPEEAAP